MTSYWENNTNIESPARIKDTRLNEDSHEAYGVGGAEGIILSAILELQNEIQAVTIQTELLKRIVGIEYDMKLILSSSAQNFAEFKATHPIPSNW